MAGTRKTPIVAYFSMEIGIDSRIPTYAGGLGVLAGDLLKAAADLEVPIVGVTLLSEHGYFHQKLDKDGHQEEVPVVWHPDDFLEKLSTKVKVTIRGQEVAVQAWKGEVEGKSGNKVPVFFLDTNVPENTVATCALTSNLYGNGDQYRLCQEVVLGVGGVRMLTALGYDVFHYHLNEGHSALIGLELARLAAAEGVEAKQDIRDKVRVKCDFTTHTPVETGHDKFPVELVDQILPDDLKVHLPESVRKSGELNMTLLALTFSHFINGVAKKYEEISESIFWGYGYDVEFISNGVYSPAWVGAALVELYDEYVPGWGTNPAQLAKVGEIPAERVWQSHRRQKEELIDYVNHQFNAGFDYDHLTLGYARRVTAYKRPDLILHDPDRLLKIASQLGPLQLIFSGKAHPLDGEGRDLLEKLFRVMGYLNRAEEGRVRGIYITNYDMGVAKLMTSGCDVWINTPLPPLEASGTSGMKAAHNGIPHLSILDGWWLEGHEEGVTGWAIGEAPNEEFIHAALTRDAGHSHQDQLRQRTEADAADFYRKLEEIVMPLYYQDRPRWQELMRSTIAKNASRFNAYRMVREYAEKAYGISKSQPKS